MDQQTFKRNKIGDILVKNGALTPSQHMYILDKLANEGGRYGEVCLREGLLNEETLSRALAEQFGLEHVNLREFKLDEAVLASIPSDAMYRYHFIPLEYNGEFLVIAIADPTDVINLDEIELLLGRPLIVKLSTEAEIALLLKRGEGTSRVLKEVSEDFMLQLVQETDKGEEVLSVEKVSADTSPDYKTGKFNHYRRPQQACQ